MNVNKQGRTPIYDNAFKVAVAREYLTGNLGYGGLAKKHGLALSTVNGFVRWYKKSFPDSIPEADKEEQPIVSSADTQQMSKQLKEANLKIAGLEMLIETAHKELGVDMVKKPGTKQS
jgi:transposase-like protein